LSKSNFDRIYLVHKGARFRALYDALI